MIRIECRYPTKCQECRFLYRKVTMDGPSLFCFLLGKRVDSYVMSNMKPSNCPVLKDTKE